MRYVGFSTPAVFWLANKKERPRRRVVRFYVLRPREAGDMSGTDRCFLLATTWDDYSFRTSFSLFFINHDGQRQDIGTTKIMKRDMNRGYTEVPALFDRLDDEYASLGQTQQFYENLVGIEENARLKILTSLRDVIWNDDIYQHFANDQTFKSSIARSVTVRDIKKFQEIVHQNPKLTPYHFEYTFPYPQEATVTVDVAPETVPPTNIHVIIGRNGVGKSHLLQQISKILRKGNRKTLGQISFSSDGVTTGGAEGFANLITVAFSAFDNFEIASDNDGTRTGIRYTYVGLRKHLRGAPGSATRNKTDLDLQKDFVASALVCLRSARQIRWRTSMRILETDPVFEELQLQRLADLQQDDFESEAARIFSAASSGHKIVLLTMTRLVELVSERTLVLIDEPETHLHPPLVASFIRALSWLLSTRNGVALLATHSPVVVQEVPQDCVSLFFRTGTNVEISRPEIETFAENVGLLTREIFRVEVTESGYHALICDAVNRANSANDAIEAFGGHLGAEGRAIARSIWRERKK